MVFWLSPVFILVQFYFYVYLTSSQAFLGSYVRIFNTWLCYEFTLVSIQPELSCIYIYNKNNFLYTSIDHLLSHFWSFLSQESNLPVWSRMWFLSVDDWLNFLEQYLQENGFSSVWMRMCERRLLRELKPRWHRTHRHRPRTNKVVSHSSTETVKQRKKKCVVL